MLILLATLAIVAPAGWIEDREPAPLATTSLETHRFHAPGDPDSVYIVSRVELTGDQTVADIANRYVPPPGDFDVRDVDGIQISDVTSTAADGRRKHLRVLRGSQPTAVVGLCIGRGAAFDACEAKLATLSVEVVRVDSFHAVQIALFVLLGIAVLGAVGLGVRTLLRRRELARSPELVDGEPVTISGVARPLTAVTEAPLSGAPCLGYRARARLFDRAGELGERVETKLLGFEVATRRGTIQVMTDEVDLAVTAFDAPARE